MTGPTKLERSWPAGDPRLPGGPSVALCNAFHATGSQRLNDMQALRTAARGASRAQLRRGYASAVEELEKEAAHAAKETAK